MNLNGTFIAEIIVLGGGEGMLWEQKSLICPGLWKNEVSIWHLSLEGPITTGVTLSL